MSKKTITYLNDRQLLKFILCPWYLFDLEVSNLEYRIIVLISSSVLALRKQQQIFQIRNIHTDELPRTIRSAYYVNLMPAIERSMRKKIVNPYQLYFN